MKDRGKGGRTLLAQPTWLHHTGYPADGSCRLTEMNLTRDTIQFLQLFSVDVCGCDLSPLLHKCLQLKNLSQLQAVTQRPCKILQHLLPSIPSFK